HREAYCKMVLHGAKYPHCAPALFVDCIPLFHGTLALAPMLEVALTLVRCFSAARASHHSVPFPFCSSPNQVAEKVASRIAEGFTDTALIMVKRSTAVVSPLCPRFSVPEFPQISFGDSYLFLVLFHPSDFCEDWTEAQRIAASLLDSKSYETLVDFDNHLDDIRNDWTNPEINKAVLHLCEWFLLAWVGIVTLLAQ
uniref:ER membrane protein complex subunit 8 n=1 Tax=Malurus cyaneus samueli TaxID=2593467 RepID=A0A8C5TCK8_9PASS